MPLDTLDLPASLVERASRWLARYDDAKLDPSRPDDAWIAEGQTLFALLRGHLAGHGVEVEDWEGYWAGQ